MRHIFSRAGSRLCIHRSWYRVRNGKNPGRGGDWSEMEHPDDELGAPDKCNRFLSRGRQLALNFLCLPDFHGVTEHRKMHPSHLLSFCWVKQTKSEFHKVSVQINRTEEITFKESTSFKGKLLCFSKLLSHPCLSPKSMSLLCCPIGFQG